MSEAKYVVSVCCHVYRRPRENDEVSDEYRREHYMEGASLSDLAKAAKRYGIDSAVSAPGCTSIYWVSRKPLGPDARRVYRMYLLRVGERPPSAEDYAAVNAALGFGDA